MHMNRLDVIGLMLEVKVTVFLEEVAAAGNDVLVEALESLVVVFSEMAVVVIAVEDASITITKVWQEVVQKT